VKRSNVFTCLSSMSISIGLRWRIGILGGCSRCGVGVGLGVVDVHALTLDGKNISSKISLGFREVFQRRA